MGVLTRAFRNVSRRKVRVLLVVIALGFSIAVLISVPAGIKANQSITQAMTDEYQEDLQRLMEQINRTAMQIRVTGEGWTGTDFIHIPYIDERIADEIKSMDGVEDVVSSIMKLIGEMKTYYFEGREYQLYGDIYYMIKGVPFNSTLDDRYNLLPVNITEGRKPYDGESNVVLIDSYVSQRFGVLAGDTMNISGTDFQVVGVFQSPGGSERMFVYMNLSNAQRILNLTGKVSQIMVSVKDLSLVDEVVDKIKAAHPDLTVVTYREQQHTAERMQQHYKDMLEQLAANLSQIQVTANQVTLISLVATSSMILFTMLYTVRERTKEIGILKALGFTNWSVMTQFVLEGTIISLIGGIVGVAIRSIGAPILATLVLPQLRSNLDIAVRNIGGSETWGTFITTSPDIHTVLLGIGVAVLLGALGSLYPAWRASRMKPVEALRHE